MYKRQEFTTLTVDSGTVSSSGRLRYGDPAAAGAKLAYKGSFAVDKLQVDEVESKRSFVTWDKLTTDDLLLTVEPNLLDVGELKIVQPTGRLIIAEDQSINLTDVLKKSKDGEEPAAATAGDEGVPTEDPFPVTVARIRVSKGALEFADLSLRPVSYTHLDVYKRQELQRAIMGSYRAGMTGVSQTASQSLEQLSRWRCRSGLLLGQEGGCLVALTSAATIAPVSYTHLDVYKRQAASRCSRG